VSELPKEWLNQKLGDVVDYGKTIKVEPNVIDHNAWILELEDVEKGSSRLNQRLSFAERKSKSTKNKFSKGDVLYGKLRPYLDKVIIADEDGYCSTEIIPIKPGTYIDNRYLFYSLKRKEFLEYVESVSHGLSMPRLGTKQGQSAPFILAPLNEQIRIANKLDSMLAKVDAAQARLDNIPRILKRFRQSVLAVATSGELTREWRENDFLVETILDGFELPLSWSLLTFDDIGAVKGGKRLPKGEELVESDTGFPYIRAGQLKNGTVINRDTARNRQLFLKPHVQEQIKRYTVFEGDVYITIVGASIGDAGVIPLSSNGANLTENAAKICEFTKPIDSKFVSYWLRSEFLQGMIKLEIKSGAQGKLALKRIKSLPIPYPPIDEQKEIVRRVESLLSMVDIVEKQYLDAKARTNRLTQSILAKAFRGELVPQDPSDEPAGELLSKILSDKEKKLSVKPKNKTVKKVVDITNREFKSDNDVDEESVKKWIKDLEMNTFSSEDLNNSFGSDYDKLKGILFSLLKENKPMINKVFDAVKKDFIFKKV
jgi:type I restriction enzyme S subunit